MREPIEKTTRLNTKVSTLMEAFDFIGAHTNDQHRPRIEIEPFEEYTLSSDSGYSRGVCSYNVSIEWIEES